MNKVIIIFLILNFYCSASSSIKEKIISQMKLTNNLTFNFIQTINNKNENGNCILKYPKKIFCTYNNSNKKIIVSNGKSLIIKNKNSRNYHFYPLKNTLLEFLLDKEYLINKIDTLIPQEIENKYINFKVLENNNEINVFFDKKNFNLIGWQIKDVYNNLSVTFISSVKINQNIDDKIFILPIGH